MNPILDRSAPGVRIVLLPDELALGGEPLDLGGRIIAFTFEDAAAKADNVSIQLDNFDLSFFESEDLVVGAVLEVSWGYPGNMAQPRRVIVKKLKGFTTLTLEGRATAVLMDRETKTRAFENASRADVARAIAKEHGFEGILVDIQDTGEKLDVIAQTGETDARFLRRLAAREEFEFYVDAGGFHFHERRQNAAPTHVPTWTADPGRAPGAGKAVTQVEVVDPETGATRIEYRRGGVPIGAEDPEGQMR